MAEKKNERLGLCTVSVVTICYNAEQVIEHTILSAISQTYDNIEYIIVDGASTDGTIKIINKYKDFIKIVISEPDDGIYDAMNKGIKHATGDWIIFMNSGDVFASENVVENIFHGDYNKNSVIYGDRIAIFEYASYHEKPAPISELKFRFPIFHQSAFIKTSIMKEMLYDTKYKICSDFDFFHKLYMRGDKFQYVEVTISKCDCISGISNTLSKSKQRIFEDCIIIHGTLLVKDRIRIAYTQVASLIKRLWYKASPSSYLYWRYKSYDNKPYMKRI